MAIRLLISDLDGVLLDFKEIHFDALNKALGLIDQKYIISEEEHTSIFDGLSTTKKLQLLSELKGFPLEKASEVNNLKQKFTIELIENFSELNLTIKNTISYFKNKGLLFCVASNAVRKTIELGLNKLKISDLVDKIYSNEDAIRPKPNPEIYLKCMADYGVSPDETIIIEDSKNGREAAVKSGAHVCGLDNSFDFTLDRITAALNVNQKPIKWPGKSDTIVLIPMAGLGSRFAEAGFILPKPLIDVNGLPMIQRVIENLNIDAKYIFIVQKEHCIKYNLIAHLKLMAPGCEVVQVNGLTEGAACTSLLAKELINNNNHLLIANSDQLVKWNSCDFMYSMLASNCDGGILTFKDNNPKWSFAKVDNNNYVTEVAEKRVISDNATVGIYYFKRGCDYVRFAEQMISKNIRVRNEFYICPVFNEAIQENKKIKIFPAQEMWGLGTPIDLKHYLLNNKEVEC